jgi:hypothetical protein
VRILYDRSQTVARLVARTKEDLDVPLEMTHCYLRAMSPIHIKCKREGIRPVYFLTCSRFGEHGCSRVHVSGGYPRH